MRPPRQKLEFKVGRPQQQQPLSGRSRRTSRRSERLTHDSKMERAPIVVPPEHLDMGEAGQSTPHEGAIKQRSAPTIHVRRCGALCGGASAPLLFTTGRDMRRPAHTFCHRARFWSNVRGTAAGVPPRNRERAPTCALSRFSCAAPTASGLSTTRRRCRCCRTLLDNLAGVPGVSDRTHHRPPSR